MTLKDLEPKELMARVMWGEARNQGHDGMMAVGCVILNRLNDKKKRFGRILQDVLLRRYAFSCLNKNDPNLKLILDGPDDKIMASCRKLVEEIFAGCEDISEGATHYYNPKVADPFKSGAWDKYKMAFCTKINSHEFWEEL